jgi:hypothetical protein
MDTDPDRQLLVAYLESGSGPGPDKMMPIGFGSETLVF